MQPLQLLPRANVLGWLLGQTLWEAPAKKLPKVVRTWCVLYILTWKCASRHNGVQFFISHLASWLRTRRFSEPTFRLSGATNHWKNTVFRDFPTFSRICIFFLLTLSLLIFSLLIFLFSLPLPCSAFHLSILSEVWLLNFLRLMFLQYTKLDHRMLDYTGCCSPKFKSRNEPGSSTQQLRLPAFARVPSSGHQGIKRCGSSCARALEPANTLIYRSVS